MMAILNVKKNDVIYPIKLYDTEAMAGDIGNLTGTLKVKVNGKTMYARTTACLSGACGGDTPLRVKSGNTVYQVTKFGEYRANPTNCFYVLNNSNNTFSKRDGGWFGDGESAYYEVYWSDSGSNSNFCYCDVTIPKNCSVIRLEGYGGQTSNNTINVKVTPGKTYRIVAWRSETIGTYYKSEYVSQWDSSLHRQEGEWRGRGDTNYVQARDRQLIFTYPEYKNDGKVKTIIMTNAHTTGNVIDETVEHHPRKGRDWTETFHTGANDAPWGNAGFMRVCFGKGNYNYEANSPQDVML